MEKKVIEDFNAVLQLVWDEKGIDLRGYRRPMLERRIRTRIVEIYPRFKGRYSQYLADNPREYDLLIDEIGINVSEFFRDPVVFELIEQSVLPTIIEGKHRTDNKEIRVWSVGCACGEEAYSIAALIHRALKNEFHQWTPYIFATDIDSQALSIAHTGVFPHNSFLQTKLGILDTYFTPNGDGDGYSVKPIIKDMVSFSQKDCAAAGAPAESVFGTFDLVLCRNVLIYFNRKQQRNILTSLIHTITPGGYLVLGGSESLGKESAVNFHPLDRINNIYRKRS